MYWAKNLKSLLRLDKSVIELSIQSSGKFHGQMRQPNGGPGLRVISFLWKYWAMTSSGLTTSFSTYGVEH